MNPPDRDLEMSCLVLLLNLVLFLINLNQVMGCTASVMENFQLPACCNTWCRVLAKAFRFHFLQRLYV